MLDRLITFLKTLPAAGDRQRPAADDPRVAVAALLFHLMDADGVRSREERKRVDAVLAERFGVDDAELSALVSAGESAEGEAVDLYAFTSVINRHFDRDGRLGLIAGMWEVVFSDGEHHELEDNIVWRVAELLHVERDERVGLRQRARAAAGIAD